MSCGGSGGFLPLQRRNQKACGLQKVRGLFAESV
jgi:hypothetical protein